MNNSTAKSTLRPALASDFSVHSISALYDWLSLYVQFANWRGFGDRYAGLTMHKSLALNPPSSSPMAGINYVNELLLKKARLPKNPKVLDAGCGFGGTVFQFQKLLGGNYDGFTLSKVQLKVARKAARKKGLQASCRFHLRNYDDPINETYDAIVAIESLSHSPRISSTLQNFSRSLKRAGLLLLVEDMALTDLDIAAPREAQMLRKHWGCTRFPTVADYESELANSRKSIEIMEQVNLTEMVKFRSAAELKALESCYEKLFRLFPLKSTRAVISAYLGGIALEQLYHAGKLNYRLMMARKT